jgi:3-hydroxybutyryl-CoA dehydratase
VETVTVQVGQKAQRSLALTAEHVETFAKLTGDYNPLHFDAEFAKATIRWTRRAGGLTTGLCTRRGHGPPGPGSVFLSQT